MRRHGWYREPSSAYRFERRAPIAVAGGIKADVRGAAGFKTWWARRWIEALEQLGQGPRLSRGRSYARNGQVAELVIESGEIRAVVQGSRTSPYQVAIGLKVIPVARWRGVLRKLPGRVLAAAQLLAGDVGAELEAAFRDARAGLLPEHPRDLVMSCTCPDLGDPCKHVAAVHYVFGAELERDPLLLFKLRGIESAELLDALMRAPRSPRESPSVEVSRPLSADPATFFRGGPLPALDLTNVRVPAVPAAFLHPLGSLPFWRGRVSLLDALTPIYRAASVAACALVMGEVFDAVLTRAAEGPADRTRTPGGGR